MLVFSPRTLPDIFRSLIIDFTPSMRNTEPANALYMLARFACLTCDSSWLEDLIIGATDAIEETFFVWMFLPPKFPKLKLDQSRSEDFPCLVFWLCNTTVWLHLMRCDNSINEACELLGSFVLVEEVINSVFGTHPELCKRHCPLLVRAFRSFRYSLRGKENRSTSQCRYSGSFSTTL